MIFREPVLQEKTDAGGGGLRPDWDAKRVRAAARGAKDADQARRLPAIAAAYEGQDRTTAGQDRGNGPAAAARLGAPLHCRGGGGADRAQAGGGGAAADPGTGSRVGGADRSRPRVRARRRGALALYRSAAADPEPLEYRLSRAHHQQAVATAWVPAHLGTPAPSRPRSGSNRRVQKNFVERVGAIAATLAPKTPVEVWF